MSILNQKLKKKFRSTTHHGLALVVPFSDFIQFVHKFMVISTIAVNFENSSPGPIVFILFNSEVLSLKHIADQIFVFFYRSVMNSLSRHVE